MRELASRAVGTITTLELPADFVALVTGSEVVRSVWIAGMALAAQSPVSTASHDCRRAK
jgi:hypothetical protein